MNTDIPMFKTQNIFTKARLKLTAWYLIVIMTISIAFSFFIYQTTTFEVKQRLNGIGQRLEEKNIPNLRPPGEIEYFLEDMEDARNHVLLTLAYTNCVIFFFSGILGYFLAGKTLSPIEKTMEEQKRFVADASHELKTPLTALQTAIEVTLRDKKLKVKDAKETLTESLLDIESLKKLTNYLLTLSQYSEYDTKFTKEEVDLKKLVKKTSGKFAKMLGKEKIKLIIKGTGVKALVNKEMIEKLIAILIDNAIKYRKATKESKQLKVEIKKEGAKALLSVWDNGVGIDKNDLPHIFERFYRGDKSRNKESHPGFGLGLAIAKYIARLHRGNINAESKTGKYTKISVKIPLS